MQFWVGLVAGLIIGWIIEWIIDWYFWRQESLKSLLNDDPFDGVNQDALQQQLNAARTEIAELRAQLAQPDSAKASTQDNLSQIDGIGKVYEQRLNEAGIFTFADMAQTAPEQLRTIIQPAEWQAVDFESWVDQAKALAQDSFMSAKGA